MSCKNLIVVVDSCCWSFKTKNSMNFILFTLYNLQFFFSVYLCWCVARTAFRNELLAAWSLSHSTSLCVSAIKSIGVYQVEREWEKRTAKQVFFRLRIKWLKWYLYANVGRHMCSIQHCHSYNVKYQMVWRCHLFRFR